MASLYIVNPRADMLRHSAAFYANCHAAKALQRVLKSNLGPRGTFKLLVGGAGQLKLTKDGSVLLKEMQLQHPTASMIARSSVAQDETCGDGTTSNVLIIGEMMRLCEQIVNDYNINAHFITEGIELARQLCFTYLERMRVEVGKTPDREILSAVSRTSLRSKLKSKLADKLSEDIVDAVLIIKQNNKPIDLFMVEIIHMKQRLVEETKLIRGMALDHGCRHPDMPKSLKNCYILTCNVSLEYENTEVNSGFFYSSAEQREKLAIAERKFTDDKVKKIVELKREVCTPENGKNFVVLNQKGIDAPSLDMLAKEGIMALRRVKRRNMERLQLCCGGNALNSVDEICADDLGYAESVSEQTLGEEKYTFVEGVKNPLSCCILVKGATDHAITQVKDAIRDGLRAVRNVLEDECVLPGAGAFELAAHCKLKEYAKTIKSKSRFGVEIFADALLCVPKTLADNSGLDIQECILALTHKFEECNKMCKEDDPIKPIGIDVYTGDAISPAMEGIYDNYRVKRAMLHIAPTLAQQLVLVDEIVKAGKSMGADN